MDTAQPWCTEGLFGGMLGWSTRLALNPWSGIEVQRGQDLFSVVLWTSGCLCISPNQKSTFLKGLFVPAPLNVLPLGTSRWLVEGSWGILAGSWGCWYVAFGLSGPQSCDQVLQISAVSEFLKVPRMVMSWGSKILKYRAF